MTELPAFKIGDVLRVSCPMAPAKVAGVIGRYVAIAWPWREIDPDSRFRWNGQVALPVSSQADEWNPYTTEPPSGELHSGDECLVGIPPTLVRVTGIVEHESPVNVGWLPRPRLMIGILPVDVAASGEVAEPGTLRWEFAEPISIEVVRASEAER